MYLRQRLSVGDLRHDARSVLDSVAGGEVFEVGAHRKAEAVLIGVKQFDRQAAPENVMQSLLVHLTNSVVSTHVRELQERGAPGQDLAFHPGEGFGRVVAWLWTTEQHERAALLVAELWATLNERYPDGLDAPSLSELVAGLGLALPYDYPSAHRSALLDHLTTEAPRYLRRSYLEEAR